MIKFNPHSAPLAVAKKATTVDDAAARKLKLKKATRAFESIFISQMLKNMRSASFADKKEKGFGKDIMLSMADEGVAKHLAGSGMLGVGDVLYQHLLKRLDGEAESGSNPAAELSLSRYLPRIIPPAADATSVDIQSSAWQEKYSKLITEAARENDLPPNLLKAVIAAESGGNPEAVSHKGAQGLMQLMPDTARSVGVSNPLDPQQNISGGARYLRRMLDRFGDLKLALAAYNAGPGAVERHDGIPPYRETQAYVESIIKDISDGN